MIEKDYLPQYAAEAVRDLDLSSKYLSSLRNRSSHEEDLLRVNKYYGELLRVATHIVLPPNAEIYRQMIKVPSSEECQSIVALPNLFTTFEFPFNTSTNSNLSAENGSSPDAMLILAIDYKQIDCFDNEKYKANEGKKHRTPMTLIQFTRYKYGKNGTPTTPKLRWSYSSHTATFLTPLEPAYPVTEKDGLPTEMAIANILTNEPMDINDGSDTTTAVRTVYVSCLSMVAQACHALNVGAVLETRKEKSYTRNRTMQKQGVGGFEYHVLRLPHGTVKETLGSRCGGGERDGPRYHFRRAHLRNLSTGAQTFVRSCFVGNRDKGVVEKNYELDREVAA